MRFEKQRGKQLALVSKKRGTLGWVRGCAGQEFTYDVSRKETKGLRRTFKTEAEAKAALIEDVRDWGVAWPQ